MNANAGAILEMMRRYGISRADVMTHLCISRTTVDSWFKESDDLYWRRCPPWAPKLLRYIIEEHFADSAEAKQNRIDLHNEKVAEFASQGPVFEIPDL